MGAGVVSGGGRIAQVSLSSGGVSPQAVQSARITTLGLAGDVQRDREHHGGPERALFSLERIRAVQTEGYPIVRGERRREPDPRGVHVERGGARGLSPARLRRVLREDGLTSGDPAWILPDAEARALIGTR